MDETAGLAAGSTSNHFRTRQALLRGVCAQLAVLDEELMLTRSGQPHPAGIAEFAGYVGAILEQMLGAARTATLARRALFAEAAWSEELRADLLPHTKALWSLAARWLTELGSEESGRHARLLGVFMDGLLEDQLLRPNPGVDLAGDVECLLRGLVGSRP